MNPVPPPQHASGMAREADHGPQREPVRPVSVAIVDDHWMIRQGLTAWAEELPPGIELAATVASWEELLAHPAFPVDVVLLDLDLGDAIPSFVKIATLRSAGVATVIISSLAEPGPVQACITAGALSYIPKSEPSAEMTAAVLAASRGEPYVTPGLAAMLVAEREAATTSGIGRPALSPQETRALVWYASGLPMKSVAAKLGISFDTAKGYIDRVREKYEEAGREARTKLELHRRAVEDGLL